MNRILQNDLVALLLRAILGFIFVAASVEKMADPAAFALSIENYKMMPQVVVLPVATILPWIEMLCGLAILFGIHLKGGAFLASSLMALFTAAVISAVIRGLDISCGCFTQDPGVSKVGWLKVGENLVLLAASLVLLFSTSRRWTMEQTFLKENGELPRADSGTIEHP